MEQLAAGGSDIQGNGVAEKRRRKRERKEIRWGTVAIDAKRIGNVAELAVAKKLVEYGFTVSWPLGDDAYDLIAEKDGHSRRVQVKSANIGKGGSYRCALQHCKGKPKCYTKADCDFIILYAPFSGDFEDIIHDGYYIIPIADAVKSKATAATIYPAGKGRGNALVCRWEKYKDGWERV